MSRLIVDDLHFARGDQPILRGIGFDHEPGRVLTLLGPSGSGKTTLLWLLAGLLKPDAGRIAFAGGGDGGGGTPPRLGFVFQDGGLWEHLTVRAHLHMVLRGRFGAGGGRDASVSRVLAQTGLDRLADRRPGELSGGERQRLSLARALVVEPQWLLLDEPTSQLDGPARLTMIDLLDTLLRSTSAGVVLATHQVDMALRLSDRIAVLRDGRVSQIGPPQEVYEHPASLETARLLGPAFELRVGGAARIVRPHQARFECDAAGEFTVRGCHFAGGHWQVETTDGPQIAIVASDIPVAPGTRGAVRLRGMSDPAPTSPGAPGAEQERARVSN